MAANMAGTSGGGGSAQAGTGMAPGGAGTGGAPTASGGRPAGWLYTEGSKVKLSDGKGSGSVWVGRGVNMDDIFFCGYNGALWMPAPADELKKVVEGLVTGWKPSFIRLSLGMASQQTVSWFTDVDKYQKPMVDAIKSIGKHAGVFVLPSSHEGQPIAVLEALSYGCPAILSDIPAHRVIGSSSVHTHRPDT